MVGAGILDGDFVIARAQTSAKNGEIVVAQLGGEVTVKRLSIRGRKVHLVAENPKYPRIPAEGEDVTIQGKVVGVMGRRL